MGTLLRVLAMTAWALVCVLGLPAVAAADCDPWAGKLVSAQGRIEVKRTGQTAWQPAGVGDVLCDGDSMHVAEQSRAAVRLPSETILRFDQDTTLTFSAAAERESSFLELLRGVIHAITRVPRLLEVRTPFVNAAVEGTEFLARATEEEAQVIVFEGRVRMANAAGELRLGPGQGGAARAGQAPVARALVDPREAVQWAIYYPPVVDLSRPGAPEAIREAAERFDAGDIAGALAVVSGTPPGPSDADFLAYRASLLLYVGRVNEAEDSIAHALDAAPDHGVALALSSVVALSQNRTNEALDLAQRAARLAPDSAAPRIAFSYVRQARFELDAALSEAEAAVERAPEDALAHARVAELRLALGDLRSAEEAAEEAVRLNPNLARTQTVLGFAYLLRLRPDSARERFEQAIALDSADPLPRLGLGLARIRRGQLVEGREEIEIAASLDPTESLVRSYLGKAYYEEKRDDLAASQYAMAKELDPRDPTPWFYDAILKQTTNRPVEALEDMQAAIERNDDRAVYRSRLALDSDLAARSASQARIYSDLGFQQRALLEGARGVWTDPGEFAAHRFLSDAYRALPGHEIARTSELLQAQLLQPLNVNPLQPQLAESDLGVFQGAGPTAAAVNEFNPLFVSDGLRGQLNLFGAENRTLADDFVVSGLHGPFSWSLGQYFFETDGWRENADREDAIYNAFAQVALSPSTSLQLEARKRDFEQGDRSLGLLDSNLETLRTEVNTESLRAGLRQALGRRSDLLISGIYRTDEIDTSIPGTNPLLPVDLRTSEHERGRMLEVQDITRLDAVKLILGLGYAKRDRDFIESLSTPFGTNVTPEKDSLRSRNAYLYAHWQAHPSLLLTLGASADHTDGSLADTDETNPKLGMVWTPLVGTTIRAAYFETTHRGFIGSQTLEPTQVAGFDQFFDDLNFGTDATRYGLGLDQSFGKSIFSGIEFSARDLDVPLRFANPLLPSASATVSVDWDERLDRAYLYWAANDRLALRAEVLYEDRDRSFPAQALDQFVELTTWSVPLAATVALPSGWSGSLTGTYVDQEGRFFVPGPFPGPGRPVEVHADDRFWVIDAELSYRLPARRGRIALGAKNLANTSFKFEEVDPSTPSYYPERLVYGRLELSF
jgi:tetratricopeptide (TPR) repeat protein